MNRTKQDLCVVIPAYNEEVVIETSLQALKAVVSLHDVFVVSDGSKDKTAVLARKHTKNVLALKKNVGKAEALEKLILKFKLKEKYTYILFSDADSRLSANFLDEIRAFIPAKPACIVGAVASDRKGFISAYRTYEYWLSNTIFKRAQDVMRTITIAPGCSSLYSSAVLDKLEFSRRTLTEDFDLTLQIYSKKLGDVVFAPRAKVITQDPLTVKDYWNQIIRWYTGFWQNILLYRRELPRMRVSWELLLLISDSIIWFAAIGFAFANLDRLGHLFLLTWGVLTVISLLGLALEKAWWAMPYAPAFILFQFMNGAAYLYSIARAFRPAHLLSWQKPERYEASSK